MNEIIEGRAERKEKLPELKAKPSTGGWGRVTSAVEGTWELVWYFRSWEKKYLKKRVSCVEWFFLEENVCVMALKWKFAMSGGWRERQMGRGLVRETEHFSGIDRHTSLYYTWQIVFFFSLTD